MLKAKLILFATLTFLCSFEHAEALESAGWKVLDIYISSGGNYGYRVNLVGVPACTNGSGFAYINDTDSNYKVFVANLMLAYYNKNQVSLITEKVNGFCHIVEVWVR